MATSPRGLQGKAIVSLNDPPAIRACFADFHMETVPITYQVGGGHKSVERTELLIFSWDVASEPPGLF